MNDSENQVEGVEETASAASSPAKPSTFSPLRIVLFLVLGIAIVLLVIDRRGRSAAESALHDIAALMPEDPSEIQDDEVTEARVHEVVGRPPDKTYDAPSGRKVEEYRWKGLFNREYVVYVSYQKGIINLLHAVTLNDDTNL